MKITEYNIKTTKKIGNVTVACVSDLHSRKAEKVINALKRTSPDIILLAGDILEVSNEYMRERNKYALDFLKSSAEIAPTYYCFGNHEIYFSHAPTEAERKQDGELLKKNIDRITSYGVHIINDCYENVILPNGKRISVGGMVCGRDKDTSIKQKEPDIDFLSSYEKTDGFKILLCHYPHYYEEYLKYRNFDLILSGHAHGGQWRIFGRGVYAPHQGLFPKYTSGVHDGKFIISRGAVNNSKPIPRLFNPAEILKITISQ